MCVRRRIVNIVVKSIYHRVGGQGGGGVGKVVNQQTNGNYKRITNNGNN